MSLPDWLAPLGRPGRAGAAGELDSSDPRIHVFDPDRQAAPTCPAFTGVRLYRDALTPQEASALLAEIEASPLIPSQSGKLKQHFGPRFNFMKRRMNAERFDGLPAWAHALEGRVRALVEADAGADTARDDGTRDPGDSTRLAACREALADYQTTDVFVLRYLEEEASNLDFHIDDLFAYGETILDVSLDSDSTLTFLGPVDADESAAGAAGRSIPPLVNDPVCVRVPLPARSIAVLYGPARLLWQHALLAGDIRGARTSITLRTLGPEPRATAAGRRILDRSRGPGESRPLEARR